MVVYDPEFEPYFEPGDIVRGSDVSRELIDATRRGEAEQVEAAVGSGSEDVVRAFSESFLGSMLHDLNVVHGALERMREPLPSQVVAGDWWNEGRSVTGSLRLAERRPLRPLLDPGARHLRIPRDDPVRLRRLGALARVPFTLARSSIRRSIGARAKAAA